MSPGARASRVVHPVQRVCALLTGLTALAVLSACAGGMPPLAQTPQAPADTAVATVRPLGPFADLNGPVLDTASPSSTQARGWATVFAPVALWGARRVASAASPAGPLPIGPTSSCLPGGAQARAASPAAVDVAQRRDRGFLWRIVRDGRTSYLYGTLHFGRPEWVVPGPTVQAALDATSLLALEMDPLRHDPADQRVPARALRKPASAEAVLRGPSLPAPLQDRLDQQARAACVAPDEWAARALPQQLQVLSVLAARPDGLEPAYAQEVSLSQSVRASRRPVLPLETVQEQRRALLLDSKESVEAQADRLLVQLESGALRRVLTRISAVWERGDLDDLERYETWCDCVPRAADRQSLRRVTEDRNAVMAARIAALHAQGHRVFAAVGAMHMLGAQSLPQQMAAQGFQVERVVWSHSFERTAVRR